MKSARKRICALILTVALLLGIAPQIAYASGALSGSCGEPPLGEAISWSLDLTAGKLTISGTGKIRPYQDKTGGGLDYMAPWYPYRDRIKALEIGEGITSIGQNAFYEITALKEVVLPDTLITIGEGAFRGCAGLTEIHLPDSLTDIQQLAFYGCTGLQAVELPSRLMSMGIGAFNRCESLTEIAIPETVSVINSSVFSLCSSLETIHIPASIAMIAHDAFTGAPVKDVYYDGTESAWSTLRDTTTLRDATIHYLREPEPTPTPLPTPTPIPEPTSTPTLAPTNAPGTPSPSPVSSPKPKPTLRPEPAPYNPYARFVGEWKYSKEGIIDDFSSYTWYANLTIDSIENNRVSFSLYGGRYIRYHLSYDSTGAAIGTEPGHAIVSEPIFNGKAAFTYLDDGHGNSGEGTISFQENGVLFSITQKTGVQGDNSLSALPQGQLMTKEGFVLGPIDLRPRPEGRTPFTDVYAGKWYVDAVRFAYTEALFNGTSATTFSPDAPMTRVQIAQVLANRTDGYVQEIYGSATCFTDVPLGSWMCAPVRWAYRNDLTDGTGGNAFSPNTPLTREQLATFLYRYAARTGANISTEGTLYSQFTDTASVSSWAKTAMQWAVNRSIISGNNGKLNPKGKATRAQVAQMFFNAKDVLASTQLLPQDERPDPDLTPKFKNKVDTDFVLKCLGDFPGKTSAVNTSSMDAETWFKLCGKWALNAYAANYKNSPGMISPISKKDIISVGSSEVAFARHCLDKPIELFGGNPETVLSAVTGYHSQPVERFSISGNSIIWTMPSSGFTRFNNSKLISLDESNGKVVMKYCFDKQATAGWEVIPHLEGTAVLIPAENSLGYKIESLSVVPG